ncbi:MAG: phosphonate C-P lyase system protein PhnH [Desulfuromonadales bacterium]
MKMQQTIRDHAAFRAVLQAMSRPGTIRHLPDNGGADPLLTLLSSLLDNEVAVAAVGADRDDVLDKIVRVTGCRPGPVTEADFLLVLGASSGGRLSELRRGTSDYPETGATVLYLPDEVAAEGGVVSLTGPGIRDSVAPLLSGIADDELKLLGEINRGFPLGVDAIFLDRTGKMTCIPRSTQIGVT